MDRTFFPMSPPITSYTTFRLDNHQRALVSTPQSYSHDGSSSVPSPSTRRSTPTYSPKSRKHSNNYRSPDRFFPSRRAPRQVAERFKSSRPVHELSAAERLLRSDEDSLDAFSQQSTQTVPANPQPQSTIIRQTPHRRFSRATALPLSQPDFANVDTQVRVQAHVEYRADVG